MSKIFPSFFICPICTVEFIAHPEEKLSCPKCDFLGSMEHFVLSKNRSFSMPRHPLSPLKQRRRKSTFFKGTDLFFLGFPPKNGKRVGV